MFPYILSVNGVRRAHFPDATQQSFGLPDEEYRALRRAQDRERLQSHFGRRGGNSRGYQARRTAFQDAGLSQQRRHETSEVRAATRAALGGGFHFDAESYGRPRRHTNEYQRLYGWGGEAPRGVIPQWYIDKYDQRSYEYSEDHDADQYVADFTGHATWRQHQPMDHYYLYIERLHSMPHTTVVPSRMDSACGGSNRGGDFGRSQSHSEHYGRHQPQGHSSSHGRDLGDHHPRRPDLVSRFSMDSLDRPRRRRDRFFRVFRRHRLLRWR
jgi:hypothetical protein